MINHKIEKKPAKVLIKHPAGSYFGDEEGFFQPVKIVSARVSSSNCSLLVIPKKKVNQNSSWDPVLAKSIKLISEVKRFQTEQRINAQDNFNIRVSKLKHQASMPVDLVESNKRPQSPQVIQSTNESSRYKDTFQTKKPEYDSTIFQMAKQGRMPFSEIEDSNKAPNINNFHSDADRIRQQMRTRTFQDSDQQPAVQEKKQPAILKKQMTLNIDYPYSSQKEFTLINPPSFMNQVQKILQERPRPIFSEQTFPNTKMNSKSKSKSNSQLDWENSKSTSPIPNKSHIKIIKKKEHSRKSSAAKNGTFDIVKSSIKSQMKKSLSIKPTNSRSSLTPLAPEVKKINFLVKSPSGIFQKSVDPKKRSSAVFKKNY